MSFEGVIINKLNGGLGRKSSTPDRGFLFVSKTKSTEKVIDKKPVVLYSINDVEALGITPSSDTLNKELTWYHLSEFFRLSPNSTITLFPVEDSTYAALFSDAAFLAAIRKDSTINVIGFAGFENTAFKTTMAAAQVMVNNFAAEKRLIDAVMIEGQGTDVPFVIADMDDLTTSQAPNCSTIIGQDPAIAILDEAFKYHAAVGTALGSLGIRKIHENLGSVDVIEKPGQKKADIDYSLTDVATGRWESAALSDGTPFESLNSTQQKALTTKAYIYVGSFEGYAGFYFNDSPTGTIETSDYARIENNCVWNKAARIIRNTLIPKVRGVVPTDPDTGEIDSMTINDWEGSAYNALEPMETSGNITGRDIYINPAQYPDNNTPVKVKAVIVANRIVHEFDVDLGLTSKLE